MAGLAAAMSSKVQGWVWDQDLPAQRKCVLLWLAERATDNGVCFPGQTEIRQKTGLSESMVRRYLHWLASDQDDDGQPKQPLVRIIERPRRRRPQHLERVRAARAVGATRTSRRELEELKHVPSRALEGGGWHRWHPRGWGACDAPQWVSPVHPRWVSPADREEPSLRNRSPGTTPPTPRRRATAAAGDWSDTETASDSSQLSQPRHIDDPAEALAERFLPRPRR